MEPIISNNIPVFLEGKSVLITGATGFLAKILLEKILRTQQNVGKLFLLMRVDNTKSGGQRLREEILETDLFKVLKMKWGESFSTKIAEKVVAVPGDISSSNLGIQDPYLKDLICKEIDVLISMAATTKFDERYDVAIETNTYGALNVLNFAKICSKIKVILHVSTAYVCKETAGVILEEPLWRPQAAAAGGTNYLDIDGERKVADAKLRELHDSNTSPRDTRSAMKDLGIHRARMHGWANTYVFTKAMGEMLLEQNKGDFEVVILRPTIVTGTCMEPFPGWIEGIKTMDSIMVAYGKGDLKCYIGDPEAILDLIPGDMVVNCILAVITCHATQSTIGGHVYQVGSSRRNPIKFVQVQQFFQSYFMKNPWVGNDGKAVKVEKPKVFTDMNQFHRHMATRYFTFLKVLKILNIISCQHLNTTYTNIKRRINSVTRLAELFHPYVFFRGTFDDVNTERVRIISSSQSDSISNGFNFDIASLNWKEYIMETHIPGAVNYLF